MTNPWGREQVSPERAALLTLSLQPQDAASIARGAGLSIADATVALQQLTDANVAIRDGDEYELTGPLCWFGTFADALAYHVRKNLLVTVAGERDSHLFLCDVRVKGGRPVGDRLTETMSVLACGRTERRVLRAAGEAGSRPTCPDCECASRFEPRG